MRKELNISKYNFEQIINNNIMYVDKTEFVYELISITAGQIFLSRPRRFGKSMLLSTLKSYFEGNKEVFKGQYLYDKNIAWESHPIIHLSMNTMASRTVEEYEENLCIRLKEIAEDYNITIKNRFSYQIFKELIQNLSKDGKGVVVLIDEYDKPILDNVDNMVECKKIRKILKSFYGQIKAYEENLRFTFITGVSKFSQVSMFSDMNNLEDITMSPKFAGICGFTQEECESYFSEWIAENATTLNLSKPAYLAKLKKQYNGVRFTKKELTLYNPVSFTKAMKDCSFDNYWFETGTPTFLLKLLKKRRYDLDELEGLKLKEIAFKSYEIDYLEIEPLLYQTGYLTIKDYDTLNDKYTLGYPNKEVRESFLDRLVSFYSTKSQGQISMIFESLFDALEDNNMKDFIKALKVYYANIDYDIKNKDEKCYQLIFYLIFTNLNFRVNTEVKTNKGRMDAVIETPNRIYIFEFKVNQSAQVAIDQIKEREYYQKYLLEEKEVVLLGVNFDTKVGQIDDWKDEVCS